MQVFIFVHFLLEVPLSLEGKYDVVRVSVRAEYDNIF